MFPTNSGMSGPQNASYKPYFKETSASTGLSQYCFLFLLFFMHYLEGRITQHREQWCTITTTEITTV